MELETSTIKTNQNSSSAFPDPLTPTTALMAFFGMEMAEVAFCAGRLKWLGWPVLPMRCEMGKMLSAGLTPLTIGGL